MDRQSATQQAVRFSIIAILAALLLVAVADEYEDQWTSNAQGPDGTVKHTVNGNTETWRIDQPNVKQQITPYQQIKFQPGDRITVHADGCVQTGGHGDTWKRYVNPSGRGWEKYYHGLIQIPGATAGLVGFNTITGPLSIPRNFTSPVGLYLRLGYQDDQYDDNGYYSHDNGNDDQCKTTSNNYGGPAFVTIVIEHGGAVAQSCTAPYDLDLANSQFDLNGLPLNPRWCAQDNRQQPALPSQSGSGAGTCSTPWKTPCTTQAPTIIELPDWYDIDPYDQLAKPCALSGPLGKHVNWGLVTYEGKAKFEAWSQPSDISLDPRHPDWPDDDYNINVEREDQAAYTQQNSKNLHTEFDSDETIDHFITPWWTSFHNAVQNGNDPKIDGHEIIEIGEIGLDCAHSCGSEIHPVLAMAINAQPSLSDDVWAIFARKSGDEGYCGHVSIMHPELSTIYLKLPWPKGAAAVVPVVKDSNFQTTGGGQAHVTTFPYNEGTRPSGFVVQIDLGDANSVPLVHGELHLQWTPGPQTTVSARRITPGIVGPPRSVVTSPGRFSVAPEPEEGFAKMFAELPLNTREKIKQVLSIRPPQPRWIALKPTNFREPPSGFALRARTLTRPTLHRGQIMPNQRKKDLYEKVGRILREARGPVKRP